MLAMNIFFVTLHETYHHHPMCHKVSDQGIHSMICAFHPLISVRQILDPIKKKIPYTVAKEGRDTDTVLWIELANRVGVGLSAGKADPLCD